MTKILGVLFIVLHLNVESIFLIKDLGNHDKKKTLVTEGKKKKKKVLLILYFQKRSPFLEVGTFSHFSHDLVFCTLEKRVNESWKKFIRPELLFGSVIARPDN